MSDFYIHNVAYRLKKEIKRLFKSNVNFAKIAKVNKSWIGNYTSGQREPGAKSLYLLAEHGIDINYILTGHKLQDEELMEKLRTEIRDMKVRIFDLENSESKIKKECAAIQRKNEEIFNLVNTANSKIIDVEFKTQVVCALVSTLKMLETVGLYNNNLKYNKT